MARRASIGPSDGSSPHTRGARVRPQCREALHGIIPAYAGSTRIRRRKGCHRRDHPRIRGEHRLHVDSGGGDLGSSPHTRGARDRRARPEGGWRIIPAYAGSTVGWLGAGQRGGDHPRIRGEHGFEDPDSLLQAGIIPAYAGSTPTASNGRSRPADHPRIRGEHAGAAAFGATAVGSSPHTRGARHHHRHRLSALGIIPAYAGSTRRCPWRSCPGRDHPRIRGEHSSWSILAS